MNNRIHSTPLAFENLTITDAFWKRVMELVRTEVIPYQWEALNDRVKEATPSWCMHNFRAAAHQNERRREQGGAFVPPSYTFRGFEALPADPAHPDPDAFYGFVFQDSDFSKWIEAVAYSLANHPDAELEAIADGAIDVVCAAQLEDGYLDTYYIINGMDAAWSNLRDHHELYCFGHLAEGAVAYYRATGKDKLLRAACRFADCIDRRFGPEEGKCKGYPGHEEAELALVKLYEVTGEKRYLDLCRFFIDQRGQEPSYFVEETERRRQKDPAVRATDLYYHQADRPVRKLQDVTGHAVRAVYLYSGVADAARLTGDEELTAACERLWEDMVDRKLYITGGIGSSREGEAFTYAYDLPNDSAYSETCAAIGLAFFARRMLQLSPKSQYADVMELALYNTVLAGMALDGKSFFYVNPLSVVPEACEQDKRLSHVKPVRQKWFGCACCPPNIARMVSSISQYVYTETADTLFVHLYAGGTIRKAFPGGGITLDVQSQMPWEGKVTFTVKADAPVTGTIALRMPGWCAAPQAACDKQRELRDGYLYLTGEWQDGEVIALDLPMQVTAVQADTRVRETIGRIAFMRGPITFCAEEADNGADLHLVRVDADACGQAKVERSDVFGHPTVKLTLPAQRQKPQEGALYRKAAQPEWEPAELVLIPYYAWANRGLGEMTVYVRA